jgi:putative acetyltransferase
MNSVANQLLMNITIRPIRPTDNPELAVIVRNTLTEFGANVPGTVYFDPTTDALFELFQTQKSAYFVAEAEGKILGGGGIYPTEGLPENTCELVKMYLLPEARGIGLGRTLIERCLETAVEQGFQQVYLETLPELNLAVKVYEKFGFEYLSAPLGNTKHFGCGLWMLKKL